MIRCPHCGHRGIPLPIEPLYSVARAAAMVSTTRATLLALLEKHQAELLPPYFRIWGRRRIQRRLISVTEMRWARERLFRHSV